MTDWIKNQPERSQLRFITCGSVDDGKSTLLGRLLWETHQVLEDQINRLRLDSRQHGTQGEALDLALLLDGLAAEREQGITIDVAHCYFATPKRRFIVADTPGHEEYTRNMVTAASTADAAVLLVDARQGPTTQTRRHAYLASLLGVGQLILAVNKMDLVDYSQAVFQAIEQEFQIWLQNWPWRGFTAIPVSALHGDNIGSHSGQMSWYQGPCLLAHLENIEIDQPVTSAPVFPVQWVNRPDAQFRGYAGTLRSGTLRIGDELQVAQTGQLARLDKIITADGELPMAQAGQAITLCLDRPLSISRGDVISLRHNPLTQSSQFSAKLVWLHTKPAQEGAVYDLKLMHQWASATLLQIGPRIDPNTQQAQPCQSVAQNDIVEARLRCNMPLVLAPYTQSKALGGFILVDRLTHDTLAAGMVSSEPLGTENIHPRSTTVTRQLREQLLGQTSRVLWFTGLSGAGKTTLAQELESRLNKLGHLTYLLDGDNLRMGLNQDLGFNRENRRENIRRVAEVAHLMADAGLIVLTAFVSPYQADRQMARERIGTERFIEIFVDTPLDLCEQRDPKGLYQKARSGLISNFTGLGQAYETPPTPDLHLKIDAQTQVSAAVDTLLEALLSDYGLRQR